MKGKHEETIGRGRRGAGPLPVPGDLDAKYSEEDVRGILDHSMDGLIVLDRKGVVRFVNAAAQEIFGKERKELLGVEFGFPIDLGSTTEIKIFRRMLGHRTVELKSSAFSWRGGQQAILLSIRDITQRRKLEEEVIAKEKEKTWIMDHMADVVLTVDENNLITSVNRTGIDLFGLAEKEILNSDIHKLFYEDAFAAWFEKQKREVRNKSVALFPGSFDNRFYVHAAGGRPARMEISMNYMDINNRKGFIISARDITARIEVENRLEVMSDAIRQSLLSELIVRVDGSIEYANEKFLRLSGYARDEVTGQPLSAVLEPLGIKVGLPLAGDSEGAFTSECMRHREERSSTWIEQYVSPIRSESGEITHFLISQEDVTQRVKLKDELESRSIKDPLTGLLNKEGLEVEIHRLTQESGRNLRKVYLTHLNVDHFGVINDACGREAGDSLLRNIAEILGGVSDGELAMARLEADTFLLLAPQTSAREARGLAERIVGEVRNLRFVWKENVFNPSVTVTLISLAEWQEYESAGAVLQALAAASRAAKYKGGDQVYFIQSWDEEISRYHQYTQGISLVHKALDMDLFCLFYQPIDEVRGRLPGHSYEILIRMRDGEDFYSPKRFLPAAEKYRIGHKIDKWVINHLFHWLADNRQHLDDLLHCGINLSAESLGAPTCVAYIAEKIEEYDIPPAKLCFEITETAAVENFTVANRHLANLRAMGCRIALDDFGTGMSSFAYLKKFEIDYLKIDGAFIRDIKNDAVDFAMVNAIVNLGRHMGIRTIAEFVEDEETLNILRLLGVDYVQGYHIGRPAFLC